MNILEKIIKEIEVEAVTNHEIGRKQCEGMIKAVRIIRPYMDNIKTSIKCRNNKTFY